MSDILIKKGFAVEIHTDLGKVSDRANLLFSDGRLRALVGVGGDGTAAELVNRTNPGVPITLLPAGTANLIAKYLKLPADPNKAALMIEQGEIRSLDAGLAGNRLFLVVVSAGIDADIVNRVHEARMNRFANGSQKGAHISYLSYIKPIFSAITHYSFPTIKLEPETLLPSENNESTLRDVKDLKKNLGAETPHIGSELKENSQTVAAIEGKWTFLFNLPQYGWGVPLVPQCLGNDFLLDYCVFKKGKFIRQIVNMILAMSGSLHRFLPTSRLGQGKAFRLSSSDGSVIPYELDGDPGGILPVRIEIIPRRFTVLAPKKTVQKLDRLLEKRNKNSAE